MTVGQDIRLDELSRDPWPTYQKLRDEEPVSWVPAANRYFVTRYDDVTIIERNPDVFSAQEEGSLLYRVMGHPFMRRDGEQHLAERSMVSHPMSPRSVKLTWLPVFWRNTEHLIGQLKARGQNADLVSDFCGPLAARNLAYLLGLLRVDDNESPDIFDEPLQRWSQTMMDAVGNYADDATVWERAENSVAELEEAVSRTIHRVNKNPDGSIISAAVSAGMPEDSLSAAIKVIIGGGINEPRDAMGAAVFAVLSDSRLRERVEHDSTLWRRIFEESIRWVAPISMYPKMVVKETVLGGVTLKPGDRIGVCVGSANRDERVFTNPDSFDIDREEMAHHAFGGGAHYCAGAWVARASVGQVALPQIFSSLAGLHIRMDSEPEMRGWVFRGLIDLLVEWDAD